VFICITIIILNSICLIKYIIDILSKILKTSNGNLGGNNTPGSNGDEAINTGGNGGQTREGGDGDTSGGESSENESSGNGDTSGGESSENESSGEGGNGNTSGGEPSENESRGEGGDGNQPSRPNLHLHLPELTPAEKAENNVRLCPHDKTSQFNPVQEEDLETECDFAGNDASKHRAFDGMLDAAILCDHCHAIFCKNCYTEYPSDSDTNNEDAN